MLIFNGIAFFAAANYYALKGYFGEYRIAACTIISILFIAGNIKPTLGDRKIPDRRLKICLCCSVSAQRHLCCICLRRWGVSLTGR